MVYEYHFRIHRNGLPKIVSFQDVLFVV